MKLFDNPLDLEDYEELCAGRGIAGGWAFALTAQISGFPPLERLAYVQHRSSYMLQQLNREGGPSLFWSVKNPEGFPKWRPAFESSPFALELTGRTGSGDEWVARLLDGSFTNLATTQVADNLTEALLSQAAALRA